MKSAKHIMVDKMTIETRNKHIYSQCKLKKKNRKIVHELQEVFSYKTVSVRERFNTCRICMKIKL